MAEFAGYDMPISYDAVSGGMLKEHLAVREHIGMFDVSHMGEFWVKGPQASAFLTYATTRPTEGLASGRAQYCLLLNQSGGIIDDIIIYKFSNEKYWVVVNASNIQKDFEHLQRISKNFKVDLQNVSDPTALIAVQGPEAAPLFERLIPETKGLKYYSFVETSKSWIVAHTGYTGEDGFEVFLPVSEAAAFWDLLRSHQVLPIGLGARDTLRLEVGFSLYGHELTEDLRPNETFSAFAMSTEHEFMGKSEAVKPPRFLPVAIETRTPKPLRAGESLLVGNKKVGWLTSGSISPARKIGIGLGLVDLSLLDQKPTEDMIFVLESAGKQREAVRTDTPFLSTPRVKKRVKK